MTIVVRVKGEQMPKRLIYAEDAIDALHDEIVRRRIDEDTNDDGALDEFDTEAILRRLPSAQPEIIRCNVCRHWHQTTGEMKGFGLGDCDYLEKKLVTCNGYCYWAERKDDE